MRGFWRGAQLLAAVLTTAVVTAGSAVAVFPSEPAPQAWTADAPVHALLTSGNVVYVGTSAGIRAVSGTSGTLLWSVPTDGDVRALALSANGTRLFAGGGFLNVAGTPSSHLVALSPASGTVDTSWNGRAGGMVRDLVVDGNRLYVGGTFAMIGGLHQLRLGALDTGTGARISAFAAEVTVGTGVYGLAKSGPNLIVSGRFDEVNGAARPSLAAVDLDDGSLTAWNPARLCPTCATYWDVAVDANNAYIASSGPGGRIAAFRLDNASNAWPTMRADGDVQAVTVAADGLVYFGGHFGQFVGPATRHMLAAVNPATGQIEGTFAPFPFKTFPGVWALATNSDTLYAGGHFMGMRKNGVNNHVPYFAAFRDQTAPPPPPPPPPPALHGAWPFNELAGTTAHDTSTFHNDGTIHGAVLGRPGQAGTSYRFGSNAYVGVLSTPSLNPDTEDFSISAYVNFTVLPKKGKTYAIVQKGVATSPGEYRLEITSTGRARCVFRGPNGTRTVTGPASSLANGQWNKIECRHTGATWSVIVDGVTASKTGNLGAISNSRQLAIGSNYGKSSGMNGRIDTVRVNIG